MKQQMNDPIIQIPDDDSGDEHGQNLVRFKDWFAGCLEQERPVFKLPLRTAVALNAESVDDQTVQELAGEISKRCRNLKLVSTLATSMLSHQRHRRLCQSICRVVSAHLHNSVATKELAILLDSETLDGDALLVVANRTAFQLVSDDIDSFGAPQPDTSLSSEKRNASIGSALQSTMTVALGLAYLRRQIEADAASRLFLDSLEINRPLRTASGAVLLASVLKVNPRSAKAIAAAFAGELKAFETEARRARHDEAMQREQSSQLQDEVRALQATCADLSVRLKVSESETSALKQQLVDEDRLARDRQETIRARVSRTLKSDVALLHVGLEAIRRDPPRVGVMDDHADRVCESLRKELQQLELGGVP
jgi:hypothetical protein